MTNEGQLHDWNVEDKTSDSSVSEYAFIPLSPLRESGSESGIDKNSSEGEKESGNDEHDVYNANHVDSETIEITEKENKEVRSECVVTESQTVETVTAKWSEKLKLCTQKVIQVGNS